MKKTINWFILIISSISFIIFTIYLFVPFIIINSTESIVQIFFTELKYVLLFVLSFLGIRYGWNNIKVKNKIESNLYSKTININFTGKIKYKDYRNLILSLSFQKPFYVFFTFIIIILILNSYSIESNKQDETILIILYSAIVTIVVIKPLLTIYRINNIYKSTNIFQEEISYQISNESIRIKGSTVDSIQSWKNFVKIKETKTFIILYQNDLIGTLIDKNMLSPKDLIELKELLNSINLNK